MLGRGDRKRRARHELRGALQAICLGVELSCRTGAVTPARARALELELGRARQALADLDGAGREPLALFEAEVEVEVEALVRDSIEAWRPAAGARELTLDLRRCGGAVVRGTRARLAQATGNLIANAIEHGAGAIHVSARRGADSIRIEVCDEGPGLTRPLPELLARRARSAWPPAGQARGHGLRIVDRVARAHGGRLELAPSSAGARFVLELPLAGRAIDNGKQVLH